MNRGEADIAYCQCPHFEDGVVRTELLANTDWGPYYAIGGEEVGQAEFDAWLEEVMVGEPTWHVARAVEERGVRILPRRLR